MTHAVLAAQLYTVRDFTKTAADLAASLKKVADIGYTAVQVSAIGPIPHEEVKQMVDDLGLTICNTHIGYDKLWNELDDVIDQHKLWECQHVAIGSLPAPYRQEGASGFQRFAAEATKVGEKLAAAGLTFSYHNHSFEFVRFPHNGSSRTALDIIFDESDPRYLQAEIDTFWVQHGGGDPVQWTRRMQGRMPVIHLKDMVIAETEGGFLGKHQMAEVGEGNMNWAGILEACKEAGVEWYAIEQDICQRDPFESLAISYKNLRGMGVE
ncbi:MAG: sugar phosphate isomerase/epimerase [Caldilineaceae bacterium]|nr:sugar phosphate isomerase/epimerase [Caldilineaceae bacterium]MCB0145939.1 sugar phosphate isomerase/epimerase [Caldilineaceae bacterium]